MAIQTIATTGFGPLTQWSAGAGYRYTTTVGHVHEYTFPATAVPTDQMVMAVILRVSALTTGAGSLKLSVRNGTGATDRRYPVPRETSFTLTTGAANYEITLPCQPFPDLMSADDDWSADGSNFDDYAFGIEAATVGSGQIRVSSITLEVVYRPEITLEELLSGEKQDRLPLWQWVEVEGLRWVPATRGLPMGCGSYYYGLDRRPVAGSMVLNEAFRGTKVSHTKGREEIETAQVVLTNVDEVSHEADANGEVGPLHLYPQGFYSWLLAYGDRTNVANTRMTDSTGSGYNTLKGLDPKDWSSTYGRRFTVASTTGFPSAGDVDDSYIYAGREAIWYGTGDGTSFGDETDTTQLLRGQFGSLNQGHEYTFSTGVYPEVTDHPVSFAGRWVKIWFNIIDEETGYPFPRSMARARMYLWGTHKQGIGPTLNNFTVQMAPATDLLKTEIPDLLPARVKHINIDGSAGHIKIFETDPILGYGVWTPPIPLSQDTYQSAAEVCSDINDVLGAYGTNGAWKFIVSSGTGKASAVCHYTGQALFILSHDLSAILGFGSDSDSIGGSPAITPDSESGNYKFFDGTDKPATTFVSPDATRVYVVDDSLTDWPTTLGQINGQTERLSLIIGEDEDVCPFEFASTPTGSDSDGDYLSLVPTTPPSLAGFIQTRKRLIVRPDDDPLECSPMLAVDTVSVNDVFTRIICSTGFGTNGSADIYPRRFGAEVDIRLLNQIAWTKAGTELPAGSQWRTYFFQESDSILSYINEELEWPTALYLLQDSEGRLSLDFRSPPMLSESLPAVLDEHITAKTARTIDHNGRAGLVNSIEVQIDYNPFTGKYGAKLQGNEPNSIRRYGDKKQSSKHRGIRSLAMTTGKPTSSSPVTGFMVLCRQIFDRWGWEWPTLSLHGMGRFFALGVADHVAVTMGEIQDVLDGTAQGVTARAMEISKLNPNMRSGKCEVDLVYDQFARRYSGYAPAAEVVSWNAGTNTATVQANTYTSAADGVSDVNYFAATYKVLVVEWDAIAPSVWSATISSISGNEITFTGAPGGGDRTPAQYDRIIFEDYDTQVAAQQAEQWVHVSSGGYIDAGNLIEGYNYSP